MHMNVVRKIEKKRYFLWILSFCNYFLIGLISVISFFNWIKSKCEISFLCYHKIVYSFPFWWRMVGRLIGEKLKFECLFLGNPQMWLFFRRRHLYVAPIWWRASFYIINLDHRRAVNVRTFSTSMIAAEKNNNNIISLKSCFAIPFVLWQQFRVLICSSIQFEVDFAQGC